MNAKNLMPGDLVMSFGQETEVWMVDASHENEKDQLINYLDARELSPIPLTEEIMEKNGFEKYSGGGYIIKKLTDDEIPSLYIWDGSYSLYLVDFYSTNKYTYIKNCEYVHELQHELKSCKIEKEIIL